MVDQPHSFWSTIPGILTGVAALISALTGLYLAINNNKPDTVSDITNTNHVQPDQSSSSTQVPAAMEKMEKPDSPVNMPASRVPVADNLPQNPQQDSARQRVIEPFPDTGPLVDCKLFPSVNSLSSLMSWSDHYHKQIISAQGIYARAKDPCNKTIDYRGMAHCKALDNMQVRQAFLETLQLCRAAGIEWQDIQHTKIITK